MYLGESWSTIYQQISMFCYWAEYQKDFIVRIILLFNNKLRFNWWSKSCQYCQICTRYKYSSINFAWSIDQIYRNLFYEYFVSHMLVNMGLTKYPCIHFFLILLVRTCYFQAEPERGSTSSEWSLKDAFLLQNLQGNKMIWV